ncbi:MAG: alpha-glucan family phosphorylase [Betaproteobacteria bacterium]|nr:alpha-glucan family phosphorylase [Betaproteobacteria bacterium]
MHVSHYLPRALPEPLAGLSTLALDLRWSWHHGTDNLWKMADPDIWVSTRNPWLILESLSNQRLESLAVDPKFIEVLQHQLDAKKRHFLSETWFTSRFDQTFQGYIAYFSMEFGLSESLPIYSGGLGVLAGDHLKTSCDLGVPLVGIGLLYQQGYFRQALDERGEQIEFYPYNDPNMLPVIPLRDDKGEWVKIAVELPGRLLRLRVWHAEVGRRTLFLLDSNDPLNNPGDRGITSELYGGGQEMRLQQEIVLGIGGWRLLEKMEIDCPVCHLNEGHAAFAILERVRNFMIRYQQPFELALRATRAGNLFTSHTPVEAGFDRFPPELFMHYFHDYAKQLGIREDQLLALGRGGAPGDNGEPFNMAYLAFHGAGAVNGVSRLHSEVSRGIFQPLFPDWPNAEVPVGHVTNGVHAPSWDSAVADTLWTDACGKARWLGALETIEDDLRRVDDTVLWNFRRLGRQGLVEFLRARLARQENWQKALHEQTQGLDPDFLTLGFARRFTEYKRDNLLLHDPQRLTRLLTSRDRPVQLVIAGKAHPHDDVGKRMIRQWTDYLRQPEVQGRIVFVEDYDLVVAAELVQGVDVWVNTPRRPWEASGTSGMKVLVNGGLNLSELDGWWAEAYRPEVGWALGDGREHVDVAAWDAMEAEQLYRLLEEEIVPCFYRRDENGLPREWIARMRESMAQLTGRFSSNRMVRQYTEQFYVPLADAYRQRSADGARLAAGIEDWHTLLKQHWDKLYFGNVTSEMRAEGYCFQVQIYLDGIPPEAVNVELYADALGALERVCHPLARTASLVGANNGYLYTGTVQAGRPVTHYTPRIVPAHSAASVPLEASLITWYR